MKLNLIVSEKNKQLQKYVNQLAKNRALLKSIIIDICSLCGVRNFSNRIPVNLIYKKNNKEIFAWFSWTPKNSSITIELNKSAKINSQFVIMVLAHEFFHLVLRKNRILMQKISQYTKSNEPILKNIKEKNLLARMILEELIVSSFIPEGYLSRIYFNKPIKKISSKFLHNDLIGWRRYAAYKIQRSARLYFKNKKTIDNAYIKKIITIIQKNKKEKRQ